jgi:hypothetical protein
MRCGWPVLSLPAPQHTTPCVPHPGTSPQLTNATALCVTVVFVIVHRTRGIYPIYFVSPPLDPLSENPSGGTSRFACNVCLTSYSSFLVLISWQMGKGPLHGTAANDTQRPAPIRSMSCLFPLPPTSRTTALWSRFIALAQSIPVRSQAQCTRPRLQRCSSGLGQLEGLWCHTKVLGAPMPHDVRINEDGEVCSCPSPSSLPENTKLLITQPPPLPLTQ